MTSLGLIFPPDQPPERLREVAQRADRAGIEELWLWEDCFAESGVATAAAALAWTERLRVGVGVFPVPLRSVALTAMEVATLARMFPDRLLPGIGHGVQEWMGQVGARERSPLTLLREHAVALRALLDGEEVTSSGRYVTLDTVRLRWPAPAPPLFIAAEGPRTLELAGELGDGVVLVGDPAKHTDSIARAVAARTAAGITAPLDVVAFLSIRVDVGAAELAEQVAAFAEAGVTRVAVCGLSPEGPPDGSPRILDLLEVVAALPRP